jgi:hypothetical protein
MAEALQRHAAGQPIYEVREFLEGEPPVDLGAHFACVDYLDAVDFAAEFLQQRDPAREGVVSALQIVKVTGAKRETVWTYSQSRAREENDRPGVRGFDVSRAWHVPPTRPVATATPGRSRLTRPLPRRARTPNSS